MTMVVWRFIQEVERVLARIKEIGEIRYVDVKKAHIVE
jgi:hypothetical protein